MACEIERKFLVLNDSWRSDVTSCCHIIQGYAPVSGELSTLRIRIIDDQSAMLTLKGKLKDCARSEFEYPIPVADAQDMISEFCTGRMVEKIRHIIPCGELKFEIDEFLGDNEGLIVAEIELPAADHEFLHPAWLGEEVTLDRRYGNGSLSRVPYKMWDKI